MYEPVNKTHDKLDCCLSCLAGNRNVIHQPSRLPSTQYSLRSLRYTI